MESNIKESNIKESKTKKSKAKTDENEILKYEIAEELGLIDKVNKSGWKSLTARESGRLGGLMARRKKEMARNDESKQMNDY